MKPQSVTTVAIDPGRSTGVVLLRADGEVELAETLEPPFSTLGARLLAECPPASCVREAPPEPQRHNGAGEVAVRRIVLESVPAELRYSVQPSEWKGHPASTLRPGDKLSSVHERDAARLGRWFLTMRGADAVRSDSERESAEL